MSESMTAPRPAPRMPGEPATFLQPAGHRVEDRDGEPVLALSVRLPSYRSLPLSCVVDIALSIDDAEVARDDVALTLDGVRHPLGGMAQLTDVWWYVLDPAELTVTLRRPLAAGRHEVRATFRELVPYATSGRTISTSQARATVDVAAER